MLLNLTNRVADTYWVGQDKGKYILEKVKGLKIVPNFFGDFLKF